MRSRVIVLAIAAAGVLVACRADPVPGGGAPFLDTGAERPAEKLGSDLPWPADAPPAAACAADADCLVVPVGPDRPDPCCEVTLTAASLSRSYLLFMELFRAGRCAGVRCPPLALPGALLADCGYQARCRNGVCGNACDGP